MVLNGYAALIRMCGQLASPGVSEHHRLSTYRDGTNVHASVGVVEMMLIELPRKGWIVGSPT
jgi:hypothetical protein